MIINFLVVQKTAISLLLTQTSECQIEFDRNHCKMTDNESPSRMWSLMKIQTFLRYTNVTVYVVVTFPPYAPRFKTTYPLATTKPPTCTFKCQTLETHAREIEFDKMADQYEDSPKMKMWFLKKKNPRIHSALRILIRDLATALQNITRLRKRINGICVVHLFL